jgi:beta-galactosidase
MILATQYYRPPFPERRFWKDDLKLMKDSGLNAVQLWCIWGWVESDPGKFNFDDYDELIEEAGRNDLGVVLSCIAEIHPFWIHRIVPDSHLIDHLGHAVPSIGRNEVNVGLTPGGCFDHPEIRKRMGDYLAKLSERYAKLPNLLGWDAWNETRWTVGAQGHTCYCKHSKAGSKTSTATWTLSHLHGNADIRPGTTWSPADFRQSSRLN